MITIDELKSVIEKLGNNNSETKECLNAINTNLSNYLQGITPDETEIESQIKRIVDIVKGDEHKYWKSNKLMTLYSNTKTDKNGWVKDFALKFVEICKNLSKIKNFNESGQDNVKSSVIKELNELDNEKNTGVSAYQISLILHCILPSYIPIFRLNKLDVFKIFKNENKKQKAEQEICNFSSNVDFIYKICESKDFPRGENNNGYDFALIDDALLALDNDELDKNMILFGPPGTGKTYNTVIYAVAICNGFSYDNVVAQSSYEETLINYKKLKEQGRIAFTTFHQSYGYEEFIEGIKPVIENGQNSADSNANEDAKETNNEADNKSKDVKYEIKSGVFKSFCDVAKKDPDNSYVFIIDEINRGNISKIFGELITLIEPTKRTGEAEAMEAILPYSNESFGVPNNVYIIGTMNTADRSIALMDTALRRRFQFVEMLPDPEVLKVDKDNDIIVSDNKNGNLKVNVKTLLTKINERIEYLYDREHTIGHAFFTKLRDNPTIDELGKIFEKSVIPLLQEYFYDDYKKIMLVLGYDPKPNDNNKTNQSPNKQEYKKHDQLIIATKLEKSSIFKGDTSDIDIPEYSYEIDKKAFKNIESYMKICNENKNNSK